MAEGIKFTCQNCARSIEAWSDGNPYYLDENGDKQYAYHPDERLALCVGNDDPHLCLSCAHEWNVDSRAPSKHCPKCGEAASVDTFELGGQTCPYCKSGKFGAPEPFGIS
jgi:predicted RNA-binding Zn-ribbon protein involved in translation (DUF1610 family)